MNYHWPGNIRELEHAMEHAAILCRGCTVTIEHLPAELKVRSGDGRADDYGRTIIRVLEKIAPVAEEMDVLICLENHAKNNLENIDDYAAIMKAIDSPFVGICIDTGHFDAAGVDMKKLIEQLGPRVNHIHLKENRGFGTQLFTKFGEGTTDNAGIVELMKARGYSGYVNIEISPNSEGLGPEGPTDEDLLKSREMFEPLMG